jgi:hypothetical protein
MVQQAARSHATLRRCGCPANARCMETGLQQRATTQRFEQRPTDSLQDGWGLYLGLEPTPRVAFLAAQEAGADPHVGSLELSTFNLSYGLIHQARTVTGSTVRFTRLSVYAPPTTGSCP